MVLAEQQPPYLLFLGSTLIMFGLFMLMFSFKPRQRGSSGILLLGPIPIVWGGGGKNRMMLILLPLLFFALILGLVFLL
ncbi:MAG: hypothetical protein ACE5JV_03725 [Nitrososphaerales archaeon]